MQLRLVNVFYHVSGLLGLLGLLLLPPPKSCSRLKKMMQMIAGIAIITGTKRKINTMTHHSPALLDFLGA